MSVVENQLDCLRVLKATRHKAATTAEVYAEVQRVTLNEASRVSIYRALSSLQALELVDRKMTSKGVLWFLIE